MRSSWLVLSSFAVVSLACASSTAPEAEPPPATAEEAATLAEAPTADSEQSPPAPITWADRFDHGEPVDDLARSPDGAWLVTRGDTKLEVWNAHTGQRHATLTRHSMASNELRSTAVSSQGWVVATGLDGYRGLTAMPVDAPDEITGTAFGNEPCGAVAFSPQGTLVLGCQDRAVRLLQLPSWQPAQTLQVHDGPEGVALSPDGSLVAITASGLSIHATDDGHVVQPQLFAGQKIALGLAFTPDGDRLVVGWHTGLNVYDVVAREWAAEVRLRQFPEFRGRHVDVSPDGAHVIIGGELLRMADIMNTALRHQVPSVNAETFARDPIFAGDGRSLYMAQGDGTVVRVPIAAPSPSP